MANALGFGTPIAGNAMTAEDFTQSAMTQPISTMEAFQSKGSIAMMDSPIIGNILLANKLNPISRGAGVTFFGNQLKDMESDESLRQRGLTPMSRQEFDAADPLPGMEYDPRMTVQRFNAVKNYQLHKAAMEQRVERSSHPIASFLGSLSGGGVDPVNWVPILGPEIRAAAAARWGIARGLTGELGMNAADAALNTAAATMATASFRNSVGDRTTWADVVSQSAMGAIAGAAIGGAVHVGGSAFDRIMGRVHGNRGLNSIENVAGSRSVLDEAVDGMVNDDAVSLSPAAQRTVERIGSQVSDDVGPIDIGEPSRDLGAPIQKARPDWVRVVGDDPQASIASFYDEAINSRAAKLAIVLGQAPERLSQDAAKIGINVSGYTHIIDAQAVRHALNAHGGGDEVLRGQEPLTSADFQRVPDILSNYDEIARGRGKNGKDAIAYLKKLDDGSTMYVEEVRAGHKILAAKTLMKWGPGNGPETIPAAMKEVNGGGPRALVEPRAADQQTSGTASAAATTDNISASEPPSNISELEPDFVEARPPTFAKPQIEPSSSRYTGPEDPEVTEAGRAAERVSTLETMAHDYGVDVTRDSASIEAKQVADEGRLSEADKLALAEANDAVSKAEAWSEALKAAATCVLKV